MSNRESIKVVCRVRPLNTIELQGNFQNCVTHDETGITINVNISLKSLTSSSSTLSVILKQSPVILTRLLSTEFSANPPYNRTFLKKSPFRPLTAF